jgi:uncharacterized protein (TIGR02118 family)
MLMTKMVVVLHKKDGMSRADFRAHWRDVHGAIAVRMPGVRKYVQNHVAADDAAFDGFAEMWFDSPADMQAAFTSEAAQEAARDAANFLSGQQVVLVEEVEMTLPAS